MKFMFFLLLLVASNSFDEIIAQNERLSVKVHDGTFAEVVSAIENQSDYVFFYRNSDVDHTSRYNVDLKNRNIQEVMEAFLADSSLSYRISGRYILVDKKEVIDDDRLLKMDQQARMRAITGRITDEMGEAIIGANIMEKGTKHGTISDGNGFFSLQVGSEAVIRISYIGFHTQEIITTGELYFDIVIKEDTHTLDEVIVIGYGTVKRSNLTGAVSTTDAMIFQSRPIQDAVHALQGELPGLTVIRESGEPGNNPMMRIRDVSSINGGVPLVLIDGAEGDLGSINSADIDNVSVLKDGTAAIYGARAADGVILVTTKSGKKNQKLRLTFDANFSVKKPALLKKTTSLYQHAVMALEITDGSFPVEYRQDELQLIKDNSDIVLPPGSWGRWSGYEKFYQDQNWNDLIIGNGMLQNYNLGLSGGGEKYTYFISLGYQDEEGLPKYGKDNNKRFFIRTKSSIDILENLQYDINLSYEASNRNYSSAISEGQNIWELIYKARSWAPLRNPQGNFYTFEGFDNPAQILEEGGFSASTTGNFIFNNQFNWQPTDEINIIGRAVVRKRDQDKNIINKMVYSYNWDNVNHRIARQPNSAEQNYGKYLYRNFTLYGEYKKSFTDHAIGIMVGTAHESEDYDFFLARRINFDQQQNMSLQLGSAEDQTAWGEGNAWTINSLFSRFNYTLSNKYLLDATLRADGSSRFHPDYRWGYFPGISAAWRVNDELFMKKLALFDELKLKASYGEMGNQSGIGLYDYIQLVAISDTYYPFGDGQKGQMASPGNIISTSRTWEKIQSTNIGIEFALLNYRLYGSFDYFWKNNNNMLIPVTYPSMLGAEAPKTNSGKLQIKGWEIELGWRDQIGSLRYSVKGSLSDAKNRLIDRVGSNLISHGLNMTPAGYPLSSYFGYIFDGIIQNEQELVDYEARFPHGGIPGHGDLSVGDAKYRDLDGDGKLSVLGDDPDNGTGDVIYLGNTSPRYNFGLNLSADFKGYDLFAFIQGVGERTMFLEGDANKPFAESWYQSAEYWFGKTWTEERTDAKYPAITSKGKREYNYYVSTNTKHNVAYARLKNLQIGYTIPRKKMKGRNIEKIRIYFSGEDLFEFHNAPGGWDPEDSGGYVSYPFARNYSLGVNIVF